MSAKRKFFHVISLNDGNCYDPTDLEPIEAKNITEAIESFRSYNGHEEAGDYEYEVRELGEPVLYTAKTKTVTTITKVKS